MKKITFLSDTHTRQGQIPYSDLPGGYILIHAGDIMNSGYNKNDIFDFLHWYDSIPGYDKKIFIAGNHDRMFENDPEEVKEWLSKFPNIIYLQDEAIVVNGIKIYGLPHTPEFYNWAFNVPRDSHEMQKIMNKIPDDIDVLITHGPPYGILDTVSPNSYQALGCQTLLDRVKQIQPKINVFGHIHGGRGIEFIDGTLFINASVLDEQYQYTNKPITITFDFNTGNYEVIIK